MIKKLTSYILILTLAFSLTAFPVNADSQEQAGRIVLSTGFETDESASSNNVMSIIKKNENVSKAVDGFLRLEKTSSVRDPYFDVTIPNTTSGEIVISADFRSNTKGIVADLFKLRYSDNTMVTFAVLNSEGKLICDKKEIGTISTGNNMTNIKVSYNIKSGAYTVSVDGEDKRSGNTGKTLSCEFVRSQLMPTGDNGTLDVDNLKIYSKDNQADYIINQTFDTQDSYKTGIERSNGASYKYNSYLLFDKKTTETDPYIDITIPDRDTFDSLVFSADFAIDDWGVKTTIFQARDFDKNYLTDISISPTGMLYQGSNMITQLGSKFINIAVAYDVSNSIYDIYIDGKKEISGAKSIISGDVNTIRLQMINNGTGSLKIDNLKVYEASVPCEVMDTMDITGYSILPDDTADIKRLSGAVAYHTAANYVFANGKKQAISTKPYLEGEKLYIPAEISSYITGTAQGSGNLSLETICEKNNKELFYDETGLIVITDGEFKYKNDQSVIKRLSTYLFSERPDEEKILSLFAQAQNNGVHPRLLANEDDFSYFASQKGTETLMGIWIDNIILDAEDIIINAPCKYSLQGIRLNAVVHKVLDRIMVLSFAYKVTGDTRYAERAWEEIETVCGYESWNPQHFLDVAELTFAISIGYDWCYDYISGIGKTELVENAIINKGLAEGERQYRGYSTGTSFIFQDMNWNSVCNSGMAIGALAIMDKNPEIAAYTLKNALRSLEYILPAFAPDGGWNEGTGYWKYTISYFVKMAQTLKTTLGTDFHIADFTGIDKTAIYYIAMQGNKGNNNYHDSGMTTAVSPELMWLGSYFNNPEITAYYLNRTEKYIQKDDVSACLYYDRTISSYKTVNLPKDIYIKDTEAVSMRNSYTNEDGMYLSFHAGKNNVNHRHFDEGSFVLDMLGERWACDLGTDSKSYEGVAGKKLYRVRAEGHNTLVINPALEEDGDVGQNKDAVCPVTSFVSKEKGAIATVDLTDAYKNNAKSVNRGFMLTDDRRTAIIRDEISLSSSSEVYWFMHTTADISIDDSNTATLTLGNKKMQFEMVVEGGTAQLYQADATMLDESKGASEQADNSSYKKLSIKVTGSGEISISVRLTPFEEEFAENEFNPSKISEWNIEEGKISYTAPQYSESYIIDSELFDAEINTPSEFYTPVEIFHENGKVYSMIVNDDTKFAREYSFAGKSSSDACMVVKTTNLDSLDTVYGKTETSDPFVSGWSNTPITTDVTIEFELFAEGDQNILLQLVDKSGKTTSFLEFRKDNIISLITAGNLYKAERNKWHSFAITLHCEKKTADVYLDGRMIESGVTAPASLERFKIVALYPNPTTTPGSYNGVMAIDNLRMYHGEKEHYFYALFNNGIRVDKNEVADEIFFKLSDKTLWKAYVAHYNENKELGSLSIINPGESERSVMQEKGKSKIMVWDKLYLIPKIPSIEIGGENIE